MVWAGAADRLRQRRREAGVVLAALAAGTTLAWSAGPALAQTAGVPEAPTGLVPVRAACGQPVALTWDPPAAGADVFRYQLSSRNTTPGSVPADWGSSDVSGWQPWTKQWNDRSEQLGAGAWGTYEVGVTAIGTAGPGPTEWATVPPCKPGPVAAVTEQFMAADRVRISWTPGPDAATAVWKYDVYLNIPGWSSWREDRTATSVEVTVPASGGVLPQVRVAPVGFHATGPATWFCDPPSRFCING